MLSLMCSACAAGGVIDAAMFAKSDAGNSKFIGGSVREIAARSGGNPAYLDAALRCFAMQGWLEKAPYTSDSDISYTDTRSGIALCGPHLKTYCDTGDFLRRALPFSWAVGKTESVFESDFSQLVNNLESTLSSLGPEMWVHQTGALVTPLMVALLTAGSLEQANLAEGAVSSAAIRLFRILGWIEERTTSWTAAGIKARDHAIFLGMVGSYIPMFERVYEIMFEGAPHITHAAVGQTEQHVDRKLNVLASGAAHRQYFNDVDQMFLDVFNQHPISEQPQFVMDVGCGDGSWLKHIYELVASKTYRGKHLDSYPLTMIGVDYNAVCASICLDLLGAASIPALFLTGDITDPDGIAESLADHGFEMGRGLHIRSFIDHNRVFIEPACLPGSEIPVPSGAYINEHGEWLSGAAVYQSTVEFFNKWERYADPHGLIVLEAHCVSPDVARGQLGDTHSLVFDTYHSFSHQYPIDFDAFMHAAREAGLWPLIDRQERYPSRKPFAAISANHFVTPRHTRVDISGGSVQDPFPGQWEPAQHNDRNDGESIHRLLYQEGNIDLPRPWGQAPTGQVMRPMVAAIEAAINRSEHTLNPEKQIAVIDYGAGSGMAALELLRCLGQRGLLDRMERAAIRFRLILLDLPSGWFARGWELLHKCGFAEFYSVRCEETGKFLDLSEVLGGLKADAIMASMVFHLIRKSSLPRAFKNLSDVMADGAPLVWSAPDVGPARAGTVAFHEANRRVRALVLRLLAEPDAIAETNWYLLHPAEAVGAIRHAQADYSRLSAEQRAARATRADGQILVTPHTMDDIKLAADPCFDTTCRSSLSFEILPQEVIDTLLIPANQAYVGEIDNIDVREAIIRGLLTYDVIPAIRAGNARTLRGYSLNWAFGTWINNAKSRDGADQPS